MHILRTKKTFWLLTWVLIIITTSRGDKGSMWLLITLLFGGRCSTTINFGVRSTTPRWQNGGSWIWWDSIFSRNLLKKKENIKKKALKAKAFSSHNSIIPAKPILTEKNEGRSNVKYHIVVNWFSNNRVWLQSCQDSLSYIRLYS